ncbi:hypothetical protein MKW98_002486 [Papaver atlanticum]|uniref:Uncharacterized protein n=1 Tax=Papaver atlanticum TaxID=357466 RepID=A0AAD4XCD6_9MAGN|nr:hypothetical protein MKW98_002486 [Papaver atlanticum]
MKCPLKITALKAPCTPHSWPNFCAVIHWLVEICVYSDHVNSSTLTGMRSNKFLDYALRSYEHFIAGDDDLDNEFREKLELERESVLERKIQSLGRICEENEELKKTIDAQTANMRDADRMKRELQAVERDIAEAEEAKSMWEEKSWDLDSKISHTFKELVNLSFECNQAIRRIHSADVLGIDYKTLKVALNALTDDIKKNSVAKLEEQISLQQQWTENAMKLQAKRILLAELQSKIDTLESQLSMMKKETEEFTMKCNMEGKRMIEDFERETRDVEIMEKEYEKYIKLSNLKLEETIKQQEEEIQACARELLALVDSVSKYKELMGSIISEMKTVLSETAEAVETSFRGSLPANFDTSSDLANLQ